MVKLFPLCQDQALHPAATPAPGTTSVQTQRHDERVSSGGSIVADSDRTPSPSHGPPVTQSAQSCAAVCQEAGGGRGDH